MKKIRILYIIDSFDDHGGTEKHLLQLAACLDRNQFQPTICTLTAAYTPMINRARDAGIDIWLFSLNHLYHPSTLKLINRLTQKIKSEAVQIIQTYHYRSDVIGVISARLAGCAIVVSNRRDKGIAERRFDFKLGRRLLSRCVDYTISVSEDLRRQIHSVEQLPMGRIKTIYNGVNDEKYCSPLNPQLKAQQLGLLKEELIIGTVANIRPIKGLEFFIQAAKKVADVFPCVQFLIVGAKASNSREDHNYERRLRELTESFGMTSKVRFLGSRDNIIELLQLFDVYIQPSLSEGFSNSLIEAMWTGKAIVATSVGGNMEAIVDGHSGILVPPKDATAIAQATIKILKYPAKAKRLGCSAKQRAKELFSASTMVQNYEKFYRSLLKETSQ